MLTPRFEEALLYAYQLHANQLRKGTQIPYFAHLMGVTALVLEDGGDEDQAIAALLHDAVEDQGGIETLQEIRRRFGERVARMVDGLTDSYGSPKPPWRGRKERYLDHLREASIEIQRISLADKLHNARAILKDLRLDGNQTWKRFRGGREGTLWYYHSLLEIFRDVNASPMVLELSKVVEQIDAIAKGPESE